MRYLCLRSAPACVLFLAFLASCSDGASFADPATEASAGEVSTFSDEDRLAARRLSLGSGATLDSGADPYEQAVRCRTAMNSVVEWFRQSGNQIETQMQAIEQAAAVYDRQVRALAEQEGHSAGDVRRDLEQATADSAGISAEAQTAIACLQQLQ